MPKLKQKDRVLDGLERAIADGFQIKAIGVGSGAGEGSVRQFRSNQVMGTDKKDMLEKWLRDRGYFGETPMISIFARRLRDVADALDSGIDNELKADILGSAVSEIAKWHPRIVQFLDSKEKKVSKK